MWALGEYEAAKSESMQPNFQPIQRRHFADPILVDLGLYRSAWLPAELLKLAGLEGAAALKPGFSQGYVLAPITLMALTHRDDEGFSLF